MISFAISMLIAFNCFGLLRTILPMRFCLSTMIVLYSIIFTGLESTLHRRQICFRGDSPLFDSLRHLLVCHAQQLFEYIFIMLTQSGPRELTVLATRHFERRAAINMISNHRMLDVPEKPPGLQ